MNTQAHRFSVAPMMDWTDRHCRSFHRVLTRRALLYSEMVTSAAVLHGDRDRLLGFDAAEHPVALQLGGSDPAELMAAARIGEDFGYREINLNVGCPSDRVQSGRFGACLMLEPALVADCMAAIRAAVSVPATVKCRIGVDDQDPEVSLFNLVDACAAVSVDTFIVHARKAILKGLSPKENRDIPPLNYDLVRRLKRERPGLTIVLNGGIGGLDARREPTRRGRPAAELTRTEGSGSFPPAAPGDRAPRSRAGQVKRRRCAQRVSAWFQAWTHRSRPMATSRTSMSTSRSSPPFDPTRTVCGKSLRRDMDASSIHLSPLSTSTSMVTCE